MQERSSFAPRVVLLGLGVSLVAALGVAFYIYVRYVRYEPVALRHAVPSALPCVVHINVQQAVIYEPFRKHLLHLFEAGRKGPESRLMHLERKTTLELGVDAREVVFGWGPRGAWLVGLGGLFRRQAVVEGAGRMLGDEGIGYELREHPTRLRLSSGAEFAVAEDGTLLLAHSADLLARALPSSSPPELGGRLGDLAVLRCEKPGGWLLGAAGSLGSVGVAIRSEGESLVYEVLLDLEGPGGEQQLKEPARALAQAPFELASVAHLLEGAQLSVVRPGSFRLEGELTRPQFEQLLARLAAVVRSALGLPI